MMPFDDSSVTMIVVMLLAVCVLMVVYGLWKISRVFSRLKPQDIDGESIKEIYALFKNDLQKDDEKEAVRTSDEVMAEFHTLKHPSDSRYLH